jgi:hypothetical protein
MLVVAVAGFEPPPAAAAPTPMTSSCTEAGVTWTVAWTLEPDSGVGPLAKVDDLTSSQHGTGARTMTWQLRWDNQPGEWAPATPPASVVPFHQLQGGLSTIGGQWRSVFTSPRLVVPDGSCTVYLSPFADIQGMTTGPRIGVLGDDLLQQLNDSNYNANAWGGYVEGNLNGAGIRVEPEAQTGRRWTPAPGTSGLARADSYLGDELRGLLEHDIDGVVAALGINDARYIAAGATEADRNARRDEVYAALSGMAAELGRAGCVTVVTAPENASNLDPDYQWAAKQVNDFWRYVINGLGTPTDGIDLVDFAADAATHRSTDPAPWFGPDNVHLAGAGLLTYTVTVQRAAERCADGVVVWGRPGTLGNNELTRTGATHLPSGQAWRTRAVDGFDFGDGKTPWFSTIAGDGTIWYMTGGSAGNVFAASGRGMTISGFNPDAGSFTTIPIKTDRNVAVPKAPCLADDPALGSYGWGWCQPGQLWDMGGWLGDVATLNSGNEVAFTGYQLYLGQDIETQGQQPVLGIVSRDAAGQWRLAEGPPGANGRPQWRNAWSPRELVDATIAADPVNGRALADKLCPFIPPEVNGLPNPIDTDPAGRPVRDCGWVNEVAVLPDTGDLVLTHYAAGMISVIDVGTPGADGRITARIAAVFDYHDLDNNGVRDPDFDDPGWPDAYTEAPASLYGTPDTPCRDIDGNPLPVPPPEADRKVGFALREVQADPSSRRRDERFGVGADRFGHVFTNAQHCVGFSIMGDGVTEFRYDPDAPLNDRIRPVSAPVISGETTSAREGGDGPVMFGGYGQFHYDQAGNLWVPTGDGARGTGVKVYAKHATGRRISSAECLETENGQPKRIDRYVASATGARSYWGKVCRPDYNLLQTAGLGPIGAVDEDPVTHNIVLTDWAHGISTVVDPDGSGNAMTFKVGNITHPLAKAVSDVPVSGPCRKDPTKTCPSHEGQGQMAGPVDRSGRLWLAVINGTPGDIKTDSPQMWNRRFEQWALSIDLSRLLGREPHQLSARPGGSVTVEASNTTTVATTKRAGAHALVDVDSTAPVRGCVNRDTIYGPEGCLDPETGIRGHDYELGDDVDTNAIPGEPVPAGTAADYRITVPKAGTYRVTYRATTRNPSVNRNLVMTVNDTTFTTPINSTAPDEMKDHVQAATVTLPAGTHTMRITAPNGGWELDWIRFTRI